MGKMNEKGVHNKLMLIRSMGIVLVSLICLGVLVSASTSEQQSLQDELNNLTQFLNENNYSWLVDYNVSYPSVEVYRENSDLEIARFNNIFGVNGTFNKHQILLTNLGENESLATFDLRSLGDVDYDYVVDPWNGTGWIYNNVSDVYHGFQWDNTNNMQVQVRSCSSADCSDGSFAGPDGAVNTYYTNLSLNQLNTSIASNRYFQYLVYMYRNVSSDLQNQTFTPKLSNVTIGHYNSSVPYIMTPILPDFPANFNDLNCTTTAYSMNPSVNVTFTWYVNNIFWNQTTVSSTSGNLVSNTISGNSVLEGDYWNCSVYAYDGAYSENKSTQGFSYFIYGDVSQVYTGFRWDGNNNIQLQVRSCSSADCSDGVWIGPDNTTASWFNQPRDSFLNLTNLSSNRYFQYRANLFLNATQHQNFAPIWTPKLNEVDVTIPSVNASVDNEFPQFTYNFTTPNTGATWTFANTNRFNVTIDKSNNTQGIQFNGINYSLTNYTNKNFTRILSNIPAGTYNYYLWAYGNGTSTNYNKTTTATYILVKANPSTNMNIASNTPVEYPKTVNWTLTETNNGDGGSTYSGNVTNGTYRAGTININFSTSGGQNYSAGSITGSAIVNKNSSTLLIMNPTTPITYGTETNFNTTLSGCPEQLDCQLNITDAIYGVGIINGNYSSAGNENYSASSDVAGVTINKASSLVYAYLNNSRSNINVNQGDSIWLNGTLITGQFGRLNLTINTTEGLTQLNYSDSKNISINYTFNDLGTFKIRANYTGNQNYTGNFEEFNVTVTFGGDATAPYFTGIPENLTVSYPNSVYAQFNATDETELKGFYVNNSKFTINSSGYIYNSSPLGVGIYNLNISINDTSDNTNSTWYVFTITQNNTLGLGLTATTPITYGTSTNFAGSGCPTQLSCSLNISNAVYGVGIINANYSTIGNENYSATSTTASVTINKATPTLELYLDGGHANIEIDITSTASIEGQLDIGQLGSINLSIDNLEVNYSTTLFNLTWIFSSGLGSYEVWFNYSGNQNYTSDKLNFNISVVHSGIPVVSITYPVSMEYYNFTTFDLNYTLDEPVPRNCWYSKDLGVTNSSNSTSAGANFTGVTALIEGENDWRVYCDDTAGNLGFDTISFYVDTQPPYFTSLINQSKIQGQSLDYTPTASDDGITTFTWNINDTTFLLIDSSTGQITNTSEIPLGYRNFIIYINDTLGNRNQSLWSLNVTSGADVTPPYFNQTGTNTTLVFNTRFITQINGTDETALDGYFVNDTRFLMGRATGILENATKLGVGLYNLNVSINDTSGNYNSTFFWVNITKATQTATLTFNETTPKNYGTNLKVNCNGELYRDDVNITIEIDISVLLGAGSYDYSCQLYGNQNYTYDDDNSTFVINKLATALTLTPTSPITYGTSTDFETNIGGCPTQLNCNVNISDKVYSAGIVNANYSTVGNQNYSGSSAVAGVTINKASSLVYAYLNNSRSNINVNQGDSIWLNGTLITGQFGRLNLTINTTEGLTQLNYSDSKNISINYTFNDLGTFKIRANYTGNQNYTGNFEEFNVSVGTPPDITSPNIQITSPVNNTNSTLYDLGLNYTVSDINLETCWWSDDWGISNYSNPTCVNLSGAWIEGLNQIIVYVNDTSGNENSSSVQFFIDGIAPVLTLINQTLTDQQSLGYDIDATDTGVGVDSFYINWTDTFSINQSGYLINISQLVAGVYNIKVSVNDTLNNTASGNMNVTVTSTADVTSPSFTGIPENLTVSYPNSVYAQFNATDETELKGFYVNNSKFTINSSGYIYNSSPLGVGIYNLNISINDTSDNTNSTWYVFTITQNNTLGLGLTATTPITYGATTDFAGNSCPIELSCDLNISNAVFGVGIVNANYSTVGNANYSASSVVAGITINKAGQSLTPLLNGINDNLIITFPQQVNASTNLNKTKLTITINDTEVSRGVNYSWGAGVWFVNFSVENSQNYTGNETYLNLTINQATGNIALLLNGTAGNILMNSTSQVNASAKSSTGQTVELYRNDVDKTGENNVFVSLSDGYYNYTAYALSNQNYTLVSITRWLNITTEVDTTPPTFYNHNNFSRQANTTININVSAYDISGISNYTINDSRLNVTTSGFLVNLTTFVASQIINLNLTATDTLNNMASRYLTLTITNPAVNVTAGTGNLCKFRKFEYWNTKLPFFREVGCI